MAWTVPATWTVGQVVTAGQLNTEIQNNMSFLQNPPIFKAHHSVAVSLANATWTAMPLDTNDIDSYSGHSTTVNNTRYVGKVPGTYMFTVKAGFASNATGRRLVGIGLNGVAPTSLFDQVMEVGSASGTTGAVDQSTTFIALNGTTDYVEVYAFQDSGGALNATASSVQMQGLWIHA